MLLLIVTCVLAWSGLLDGVHGLGMAQTTSLPAVEMEALVQHLQFLEVQ
jgi:hypothetical protein